MIRSSFLPPRRLLRAPRVGRRVGRGLAAALVFASGLNLPAADDPSAAAAAARRHQRIVENLAAPVRQQLAQVNALTPGALARFAQVADPAVLAADTEAWLALGVPAVGTRPRTADGRAVLHGVLEQRLRAVPGLELVGPLRGEALAPVPLAMASGRRAGEATTVQIGAATWPLAALWPNGVMPSLAPAEGITGPLVDVGTGEWAELEGKPLVGSIAVAGFSSGRRLERLFSLGAAAVVVVPDGGVTTTAAEGLFSAVPAPLPRFYADAEVAVALRAAAATGAVATVRGGQVYEPRVVESWFAYLPPTAPVTYTVEADTTWRLLAGRLGASVAELQRANPDVAPDRSPPAGTVLGRSGGVSVTVREGEILRSVAELYGVSLADLTAANPGLAAEPAAGSVLTVPNLADTVVVVVPIDAVSVVPELDHGAKVMANLAFALRALEYLATDGEVRRRKGLLVAFTDGDTMGGVTSRLLAAAMAEAEGVYRPSVLAGIPASHYVAARAALVEGAAADLPEEVSKWLFEDWLVGRADAVRIRLAEQRAEERRQERDPAAVEQRLATVVEFRRQVINPRHLAGAERVARWQALESDAQAGPVLLAEGLTRAAFAVLMAQEQEEDEVRRTAERGNQVTVARLRELLQPAGGEAGSQRFGLFLDLSDGSRSTFLHGTVGGADVEYRRAQGRPARLRQTALRSRDVLSYAAWRAGWTEEMPFYSDEENRERPVPPVRAPGFHGDFWAIARVSLFAYGAAGDAQPRLDTPADVPTRFDFATFGVQARNLLTLLALGLENPADSPPERNTPKAGIARLTGRVLEFNLRAGLDARDPVGDAIVFFPALGETSSHRNALSHRGYRRGIMARSLRSGWYFLPAEDADLVKRAVVRAYWLNRDEAVFTKVATEGVVGSKPQEKRLPLLRGQDTLRNLVLAPLYPLTIFPGVDPSEYKGIGGGQYSNVELKLLDAVTRGAPREFAVDNPTSDFREASTDAWVIYGPRGRRLMVLNQSGIVFKMMLLGELNERGQGQGYRLGPVSEGGVGPRLALTEYHIARDMDALGRWRDQTYRQFGITSKPVESALAASGAALAQAEAAIAGERWQEAVGASRESWGVMIRGYPRVLTLGRQALFSAVLLMALLVPGAWFLERLVLRARGIVGQLAGASGLFLAGTLALNALHPAFRIALSPFIVVIAFTMILMSIVVLGLCYQRFEGLLKRMRTAEGEVTGEGVTLADSLATALNLGLSNLRKYPLRTGLTTLTVAALSFSVIAFVAVQGGDVALALPQAADRWAGDEQVEPEPPAYEGLLFRNFGWQTLGDNAIAMMRTEFGAQFPTAQRGFYLEVEGGNNAARDGVNQIRVSHGRRTGILTGLMTFEHVEPSFSGLDRAVTGEWFAPPDPEDPESRREVILPDRLAAELGITADQIVTAEGALRPRSERPVVRLMSRDWRVRGLLDVAAADRLRDVNGKSLALVDHLRSAMSDSLSGQIEQEGTSYHLSWRQLGLVPFAAGLEIGAKPRSFAVRVDDGAKAEALVTDLTLRRKDPFYSYRDGEYSLIAPRERFNFAGLAKILLPVALCLVIVMNTMLGNVEERRPEIEMLGAIGLSPRQISFLFLSESSVYAILGILAGMLGGLLFANVAATLNANGVAFFPDLSMNFTSLASVALAGLSGVVVLLASYLPATQAAAHAAPSGMMQWTLPEPGEGGRILFHLPFSLTGANAVGMVSFLDTYFGRHRSADAEGFSCRGLDLKRVVFGQQRSAIVLQSRVWLAPYDLDVAQLVTVCYWPTATAGVFRVSLALTRLSGSEESWIRTNYGFLNDVRKQFLVWRNLPLEAKARFVEQGRQHFRDFAAEPAREDREAAALAADLATAAPAST